MIFPDDYESRRRAISYVEKQTAREHVELVLVRKVQAQFEPDEKQLGAFGSYQIVEIDKIHFPGEAYAVGVRAARAPIVAYVEEHSFPEPGWADALIRAHSGPYAAVGAAMGNANPNTLTSWINLFEEFGPLVTPAASHVATYLGGHHTSYKRDILLTYGDDLPRMLESEMALHIDLQARGHSLYLEGGAVANHVNISQVGAFLRQDYCGQRSFAATRAHAGNWTRSRRALYILAAPLIPFVRLRRIIKEMQRTHRAASLVPKGLPLLLAGLTCGTLGEIVGYAIGDSESNIRMRAEAELDRSRFLTPTDQARP